MANSTRKKYRLRQDSPRRKGFVTVANERYGSFGRDGLKGAAYVDDLFAHGFSNARIGRLLGGQSREWIRQLRPLWKKYNPEAAAKLEQ